jgi:hypothetical protein
VAAAVARYLAWRFARDFMIPLMLVSASATVGSLYYTLLK